MKKNRFLSIALLIALFLGLMLFVKNYKQDGQEIVPPVIEETTNVGELVVNNVSSNKMKLTKKMNAVNPNSIQVVATLEPTEIIDNTLEWTLAWAKSSAENVNDYITLNVASDTQSATITYKKQFNTQIVLTVKSKLTPSVSASLTLDCYKRTTNFNLSFEFEGRSHGFYPTINESQKTLDFSGMNYSDLSDLHITECDLIDIVSVGTVNVTNRTEMKFSLSQELKTKLQTAGITFPASSVSQYDEYAEASYYADLDIWSLLYDLINITDSNKVQVFKILGTVNYWFDLSCKVTDLSGTTSVNSFEKVYKMQGFNISDGLNATSVTLNKTNYIF